MLDRFTGTVEVEVIPSGNNLYLAVAFDGIEMFVIPAEKNEGIYLGKRDFRIQCFQEAMGRGQAAKTRGRFGVDLPGEAGQQMHKGVREPVSKFSRTPENVRAGRRPE